MRYVAPKFHYGRVGHQLSVVWQARLVSEFFGLQYAHVPFSDYQREVTGTPSPVGLWNDFLGLGRGETALASVRQQLGAVTYEPPLALEEFPTAFSYEETWRLLDAVPDNHVLIYENIAPIMLWPLLEWQSRGLVTAASVLAVPCWFQRQLQQSAVYTATRREPPRGYRVVAYRRTPLAGENLPPQYHAVLPVAWFNDVLARIRIRYPDVDAVLYTQNRVGDEAQLNSAWTVREAPDTYPATFEAFKDLVEADVAVISVGSTAGMIEMYRCGRGPTVHPDGRGAFPGLTLDTIVRDLP